MRAGWSRALDLVADMGFQVGHVAGNAMSSIPHALLARQGISNVHGRFPVRVRLDKSTRELKLFRTRYQVM